MARRSDGRTERGGRRIERRTGGRGRTLGIVVLVTLLVVASVPTVAVGQGCEDVSNVGGEVDGEPPAVAAGTVSGSILATGVDGGGSAFVDERRYRQAENCPTETERRPDGGATSSGDGGIGGAEGGENADGADGGEGTTARNVPDGRVLLDGQPTELGAVTVEGSTYAVYRFDNALPYAGGVEVYVDGERVTDPEAARAGLQRVAAERALDGEGVEDAAAVAERAIGEGGDPETAFQRVAWEQAVSELGPEDVETLQNLRSTAADIDSTLSPAVSTLDSIVGYVDRLKNEQVLGQSAWDLATAAAPSLEGFDRTIRSLRDELTNWQESARAVDRSIPPVVDALQRMERGESVDYDRLSTQFQDAMTALDDLQRESAQLESRLSEAASTSSTIASRVDGVPVVGGAIADRFQGLADTLRGAADDVGSFASTLSSQQSSLQSVQTSADGTRSSLQSTYEDEFGRLESQMGARNSASLKVYGTGGVGVAALAVVARRLLG